METIRKVSKVPTDMADKPRIPVHIFNCGELHEDDYDDEEPDSEEEAASNAFLMYQRMQRRRELKGKSKIETQRKELTAKLEGPSSAPRSDDDDDDDDDEAKGEP